MKTIDKKAVAVRTVTAVFLLFSCFFMYDFYKCLSGFIANGFREPQVMLPMILSFFLPVLCFFFFFYDFFVRAIKPSVKLIYSVFTASYAIAMLVMIFSEIDLYASNNALGVYDVLPSVILHFPYDMIVLLFGIVALQIFNIVTALKAETTVAKAIGEAKQRGCVHVGLVEYIAICVPGVFVLVFTASAICAVFTAFANAFYDLKFVFLLVWVMLVPMADTLLLVLKPERMDLSRRTKTVILSAGVGMNLVFGLAFLLFELIFPGFLIHISKPLFLIAFSISLPVEPIIIVGIMAVSTVLLAFRLVRELRRR